MKNNIKTYLRIPSLAPRPVFGPVSAGRGRGRGVTRVGTPGDIVQGVPVLLQQRPGDNQGSGVSGQCTMEKQVGPGRYSFYHLEAKICRFVEILGLDID